jgi:hypothetical protein
MSRKDRIKNILKKGIILSGFIMRSLIGIGATALLFFSLKKKKNSDL